MDYLTIDENGVVENIRCPYLICHGGSDVLSFEQVSKLYNHARARGVDVTLRLNGEEETGTGHCQHDNPTLGQEYMTDWLASRFEIDQIDLLETRRS